MNVHSSWNWRKSQGSTARQIPGQTGIRVLGLRHFHPLKPSRLTALGLVYNHLVMEQPNHATQSGNLDAVFAALADPTRRAILLRLAAGDASVNEIAAPFDMSQPAVSKHLKMLGRAGLIQRDV